MAAAMPAPWRSAQPAPPAANDAAAEWEALAREEEAQDAPVVDSPSISADWPAEGEGFATRRRQRLAVGRPAGCGGP